MNPIDINLQLFQFKPTITVVPPFPLPRMLANPKTSGGPILYSLLRAATN